MCLLRMFLVATQLEHLLIEVVFADGEVTHIGQVIGMVLAENRMIARRAAKLVKVSYTDLPSIITIKVTSQTCANCTTVPPLYSVENLLEHNT